MGRICKMTALSLSSTDLSRIAISSACCAFVGRPFFDGQSILLTVATQTPRNSRAKGGGSAGWAMLARTNRVGRIDVMQQPFRRSRRGKTDVPGLLRRKRQTYYR